MSDTLFKPPMTIEQLQTIQDRNKGNADVLALLWEIKRLHAIILRADQVQRDLPNTGGAKGMILDVLRSALNNEPVVLEDRKLRGTMLASE